MTTPTFRAAARADRLNEIVAAYPLHSGRVIRSIALVCPSKRSSSPADYATA